MAARILYVDDDVATGRSTLDRAGFQWRPLEITPAKDLPVSAIIKELAGVDLVLMDYELHEADLVDQRYVDGLELLERFRAAIRQNHDTTQAAPALALFTGKVPELAQIYESVAIEPFLARAAKVDWVFRKGVGRPGGPSDVPGQIRCLVKAVRSIHKKWSDDSVGVEVELKQLFALNRKTAKRWSDLAFEEFRALRPPIQGLIDRNDGNGLLRWILHVALPFPSCLVDLSWIALKLRIRAKSLRDHIDQTSSGLTARVDARRYRGPAAEFLGSRYWKAGIDELAWSISRGKPLESLESRRNLGALAGREFEALELKNPVAVISPDDFTHHGELAELDDSVQIQPDYWPPSIESPWIKKSDVSNDKKLRAIVVNTDIERLTN